MTPLTVLAPLAGRVVDLSDVPDAVFAGRLVGPGLAIDPAPGPGIVVAPVAGVLAHLRAHAFVVQAGARGVLVHLGVDTVELAGAPFEVHAHEGDLLDAGEVVLMWDAAQVAAAGRSVMCPVVAMQAAAGAVVALVTPGEQVARGQPLLRWA